MHSVYYAVWVAVSAESMEGLADAIDKQISVAAHRLVEERMHARVDRRVFMPVYHEIWWPIDEDHTDA
jgi:hypothetical protein